MPYVVEVDQSGKVEYTQQNTVLVFAGPVAYSVLIPATVKRECIQVLRHRGLPGTSFYLQLYATALYFLLRGRIEELAIVRVDNEYPGHEAQVKEHLINLLRRYGRTVDPDQIAFHLIGKKSPAHVLALDVYRGNRQPDIVLTLDDLLGEFRGKEK